MIYRKHWSEKKYAGLALVGTRNYQFPEKGDLLRIALNSDDLGSKSQYFLKNDIDYWAGVIAHEILHNCCTRYSGNVPADFNLTGGREKNE